MSDAKQKILLVEDDPGLQKQLKWSLSDYELVVADDRDSAITQLRRHEPAVVLLDLGLPPDADGASEGLRALAEIIGQGKGTKVVVVSGNADRANALKAIELGAYDFCNKPVELDELRIILSRAFHVAELEAENLKLKARRAAEAGMHGIFGQCPQMEEVFASVAGDLEGRLPLKYLCTAIISKYWTKEAVALCSRHSIPIDFGKRRMEPWYRRMNRSPFYQTVHQRIRKAKEFTRYFRNTSR